MLLCVNNHIIVNTDINVYLFIDLGMKVKIEDATGKTVLRSRDSNIMREMFLIKKIKEMLFVVVLLFNGDIRLINVDIVM
jgi:hypothetical protein